MLRLLAALFAALAVALPAAAKEEAAVRKAAEAFIGGEGRVEGVSRAGFLNLWEVRVNTQQGVRVIYTDDAATHFIIGSVIDAKTETDLTAARMSKLNAIKFSELPLNQAFKIVRGKGTRQLAYFSDPRCSYCKRFDQELVKMDDITVHVFMLPIIAPDSGQLSRQIWCSPDRAKAWQDMMLKDIPPTASASCPNPVDRNLELGKRLRVSGTPLLVLADGQRISGWRPAAQLSELMDQAAQAK